MLLFRLSRSILTFKLRLTTYPGDMPAIRHTPRRRSRSNGNDEDASSFLQNQITAARAEFWFRNRIRDSNAHNPSLPPLTDPLITSSIRPIKSSVSPDFSGLWETFTSETLVPLPAITESTSTAPCNNGHQTRKHRACKTTIKKPQNAFSIFCHYLNMQGTFLAANQQDEVSAKAGELWGRLGKDAQQKFYDSAELEKLRMQRECKAREAQGESREGSKRFRCQEEKAIADHGMEKQVREPSSEVAVCDQSSSNSYQLEQVQDLLSQTLVKAPRIKKGAQSPAPISFLDSVSSLSSRTSTPSLVYSSSSLSSDPSSTESEFSSGEINLFSSACHSSQASETSVPPQPLLLEPSTQWWRVEDGFFERTIDPIAEDPFFPSTNAAPGAFCFAVSDSSNSTTLPASALSTGFGAMYPPLQNYNNPLTSDWNGGKLPCKVSGSNHSSLS